MGLTLKKSKVKHLRSLKMNYAGSPYFSEVYRIVSSVLEREDDYISSISIKLIREILSYLGYKGEIILSSDLSVQGKASDLILDLCVAVEAKQYLSGIGGKNYLVQEDFDKSGINVEFQKFCLPEYEQRFSKVGFIPDLSILDLLFNKGKESKNVIKSGIRVYSD